jgi:hypothetical protein
MVMWRDIDHRLYLAKARLSPVIQLSFESGVFGHNDSLQNLGKGLK